MTHGDLGQSLLKTALSVCGGDGEGARALSIGTPQFKENLADAVKSGQDGLIIMADLFGGSGANSAAMLLGDNKKSVLLCGVNLNMLFSFFHNRSRLTLEELAQKVLEDAKRGIVNVNQILAQAGQI